LGLPRQAVVGIIVALVVLLIGGVYVLTNDDGKKKNGAGDNTEQAAGEIFLEPISDVGPAPFTDDFDTNTAPAPVRPNARTPGSTTSSSSSSGPSTSVPATALRGISGTVPGLYGGSEHVVV